MGKKQNGAKKNVWKKVKQGAMMLVFVLMGAVCGYIIGEYMDRIFSEGISTTAGLLRVLALLAGIYVVMMLQVIVHEAGHLVFGLLTGYRFASFRIGSFMWKKEKGRLKLCRMSLAGTAGQCLMAPPEREDGKMPCVLYHMGGSIANLIAAVLSGLLCLLCRNLPMLSVVWFMMAVVGVGFAVINGVPFRTGTIDNDGYNALSSGKNPEAVRAFWLQMKINEQISQGVRLKDMPDEWFVVPSRESMKNSMVAAVGAFCCNRKMDAMEFEEAGRMMAEILEKAEGLVDLYRCMMRLDQSYCEMIGENRREIVDNWLDEKQRKFMKSMKRYPTVLRTEYTYALLVEQDREKAEAIRKEFEKMAKTYPHPVDIESERELLDYAVQIDRQRRAEKL